VDRLNIDKLDNVVFVEPAKEMASRPVIGVPGVLVADRRSKEFQKTARSLIAGIGDRHRHSE
jgi:hypothetical protein